MNSVIPSSCPSSAGTPAHSLASGDGRTVSVVDELTVTEVRTTEGFASLAPEWRTLLSESDTDCLFLTWEWLYTWWVSLAGKRELRILTIRRGKTLIGIAPFAMRAAEPGRLLPFRAIEFLGVGAVGSDYLDLILKKGEEDPVCTAIADYVTAWKLLLDMRRVALGGANVERLVRTLVARGWSSMLSGDDICLYVTLSGSSWDQYFSGLSREFRRSLRRGRRNAQSAYAVTYTSACRGSDRSRLLQTFIDLHHERWKSRDGSQALPDSSLVQFHEQWSRLALDRGWLRLSILSFDETPVAGTYGFAYGGKLYFYLTGFNPAYATYGVGRMCLEESLQEAFEEGLEEYDFLHGDEKYKYHWARDSRPLGRYRLFPPGIRGYASKRFFGAREGVKWLLRKGSGSGRCPGAAVQKTASPWEQGK